MEITNTKVKSLVPEWANFKGFSLLFDQHEAEEPLYRALYQVIEQYKAVLTPRGFCPLPLSSYHMTLWDGFNDANYTLVQRDDWFDADEDAHITMEQPITFKINRVLSPHNIGIVTEMVPADEQSALRFEQLLERRTELNQLIERKYGFKTADEIYKPHISLGYFANPMVAGDMGSTMVEMNRTLAALAGDATITFHSNSVYEYYSMARFVKRSL